MAIIEKTEISIINDLYWNKEMSAEDIAKMYDCHCMTVLRFMKNNNIPIRNTKERTNTSRYKQKISTTSSERWLDDDYKNNQISKRKGKPSGASGKTWTVTTGRIYDVKREKNPMWRGGKTELGVLIRTSDKYKEWRKKVFERDNYTCQSCGRISKIGDKVILECHHKIPLSVLLEENNIKNMNDAIDSKCIFDVENGLTLCKECHKKTDSYGVNKKYVSI